MNADDKDPDKLICLGLGICHQHVCAPKAWPRDKVEQQTNFESPTGISSQWSVDDPEGKGPVACEDFPDTRQHWILTC